MYVMCLYDHNDHAVGCSFEVQNSPRVYFMFPITCTSYPAECIQSTIIYTNHTEICSFFHSIQTDCCIKIHVHEMFRDNFNSLCTMCHA